MPIQKVLASNLQSLFLKSANIFFKFIKKNYYFYIFPIIYRKSAKNRSFHLFSNLQMIRKNWFYLFAKN